VRADRGDQRTGRDGAGGEDAERRGEMAGRHREPHPSQRVGAMTTNDERRNRPIGGEIAAAAESRGEVWCDEDHRDRGARDRIPHPSAGADRRNSSHCDAN